MGTACTVKYLEPNENLFNILDDWMEKYNTSPKRLLENQQGMFSLSIELTDASQNIRESLLASLRDWAESNGVIVFATGAFIVVYVVSSLLSNSSIRSFVSSQVGDNLFSNISYFQNLDILSDITPGVYYLDGLESEKTIIRSAINDIIGEYQLARNMDEHLLSIEESEELSKQSIDSLEESIVETQAEIGEQALESDETSFETSTMEDNIEISSTVTGGYGVEINIPSSVPQTGLCRNNTPYGSFYGRWTQGTMQRIISEQWADAGMPSSNGIATLNGRYLVAVSTKFGCVGDNIDIVLTDGQVIPATIADAKGSDATSEWGHVLSGAVDIVEWEASGDKTDIDLDSWENVKVLKIINYGSGVAEVQTSVYANVLGTEVASTEEQYIELYSKIYGLNEKKVYQIISDMTDGFSKEIYDFAESEKMMRDTKEKVILLAVRNIYYNPENYGYTASSLKGTSTYESNRNYAEEIEHMSNVLGVDPVINYSICQALSGFKSPMFLSKNNPTNIMRDGVYLTFPTVSAGFAEATVELSKMFQDNENLFDNPELFAWSSNVLEIYNYVSNNYDSVFRTRESEKKTKPKEYTLTKSIYS